MSDRNRQDRVLNVVLGIVLAVTIGHAVLALASLPALLDTRAGVDAQRRSDEITACRSAWSAELVTGPTVRALRAIAEDDEAGLAEAVADADPERFEALAAESRVDPAGFLVRCRTEGPGGG